MDLRSLFNEHKGNLIHKWDHYFPIYERYFSKYKGLDIYMLEIGVSHGGSLQLWSQYFGKNSKIFAIDVNPECKKFEGDNIKIFIGSQSDPLFLKSVVQDLPLFDIILDDGGHTMKQQITSFKILYPHLKDDGIYMCEDTHTSYWYEYQGGLRKKGTFIEYSKALIDKIHAWYINDSNKIKMDNLTTTLNSIHFYDSIIVFEKTSGREKPFSLMRGNKTIKIFEEPDIKHHNFLSKLIILIKKKMRL